MSYKYDEGYERFKNILDNDINIIESNVPQMNQFTFSNAFRGWVTAIFVDIRDSSSLPSVHQKRVLAKLYRSYISEVTAKAQVHCW